MPFLKGIMLAETKSISIAAHRGDKMMLEKLLMVSNSKLNKVDSEYTILLEAYRFRRDFSLYLIEHYQSEWRTVEPSFINAILLRLDFPFVEYLIARQEKLSSTFFNHCITQFITFENLNLLKLLLLFYPDQSARQFGQEDNLILAAQVSSRYLNFYLLMATQKSPKIY